MFITQVPKVFNNVFLFIGWTTLGTFIELIGWCTRLSVQTIQPLIVIKKRDISVYHNWGYTSIYWPLSFPLRFLVQHCMIAPKKCGKRWPGQILIMFVQSYVYFHSQNTDALQGYKGIRQWLLNWCTSPMMIHKITPFGDKRYWLKTTY